MVEEEERSEQQAIQSTTTTTEFNSTMISETSHLNELQKENRAPPLASNTSPLNTRLPPSILSSNTPTTFQNYSI